LKCNRPAAVKVNSYLFAASLLPFSSPYLSSPLSTLLSSPSSMQSISCRLSRAWEIALPIKQLASAIKCALGNSRQDSGERERERRGSGKVKDRYIASDREYPFQTYVQQQQQQYFPVHLQCDKVRAMSMNVLAFRL